MGRGTDGERIGPMEQASLSPAMELSCPVASHLKNKMLLSRTSRKWGAGDRLWFSQRHVAEELFCTSRTLRARPHPCSAGGDVVGLERRRSPTSRLGRAVRGEGSLPHF